MPIHKQAQQPKIIQRSNTDLSFSTDKTSSPTDSRLVEFVETLQSINTDCSIAKLNESTISDNNGGRIKL